MKLLIIASLHHTLTYITKALLAKIIAIPITIINDKISPNKYQN